jgi:predicted nucleic acid-binding protein
MSVDAALAASDAWKAYRRRGGRRERLIADFLIGAHAQLQAERLLTRDRGFYFAKLSVLDPATM